MRTGIAAIWLALLAVPAQASERWTFDKRIDVTGAPVDAVYHHLDGAGRKHIAVTTETVALVWEDNRSQEPQIYATLKSHAQKSFPAALPVSGGNEAYEPTITVVGDNRYLLAYEQDMAIFARILTEQGLSEPARLSQSQASHASLASRDDQVFASWRVRDEGRWFVMVAALGITGDNRIAVDSRQAIEGAGLETPVLFPVVSANEAGVCVAWEDRRAGHTRLLFSHSADAAKSFAEPQSLNEFFSNRTEYDRGNGVTRVSLASFGADETLAAWMDKRRGGSGYGIFAALGDGENFGPNEKVHGEQGDTQPHYNPATAGNLAGDFVVAWDDFRHGDSDIWISTYNDDLEWSQDYAPRVASGSGEQSHPAIALDEENNLHLLWIERDHMDAASRLWYSRGRAQ